MLNVSAGCVKKKNGWRLICHMCPKDCRAKWEFVGLEQLVVAAV